jgi:ATP-dependent protease ClpP protease subunit
MSKETRFIKNIISTSNGKKGVICLYSEITEWEAEYFVQDLTYLANETDEIEIRINSIGGSVIGGFSIFSCITRLRNEGKKINTFNDGLCASVAGWLFQAGEKRYSADFSLFMMHDPYNPGSNKSDNEVLNKFKNAIVTILEANSSLTKDQVVSMMAVNEGGGTWMDASEQINYKLADEIFATSTGRELKNTFNKKTDLKTLYKIANQLYLPKNKVYMKVNNLLNLHNEASEEAQVQAITAVQNKLNEFDTQNSVLKQEVAEQKTVISDLENQIKLEQDSKIDTVVANAIEKGQIKEEDKEVWSNLLAVSFENGVKALNAITVEKTEHVDLTQITNTKEETKQFKNEAEEYDHLQKNDPAKLAEIMTSEPERFDNMLNAYKNK